MSNPYAAQTASAARVLAKKGQQITVYRLTLGSYDPLNPAASVPTVDRQFVTPGVILPANTTTIGRFNKLVSGDLVKAFRLILLSGLTATFTPREDDILKTAEGYYRLYGVDILDPAGAGAILYSCGAVLDTQLDLSGSDISNLPTSSSDNILLGGLFG